MQKSEKISAEFKTNNNVFSCKRHILLTSEIRFALNIGTGQNEYLGLQSYNLIIIVKGLIIQLIYSICLFWPIGSRIQSN